MGEFDFETMDKESIQYATEETDKTKEFLNSYYEKIEPEIDPYVFARKIKAVSMKENKICFISINNGKQHLLVNDNVFYSTDGIIVWIKVVDTGNRIAMFETKGSDSGILKVFKENNVIYQENGLIQDIIFTPDSFYIVKETRNEKVTDINYGSNAVFFNNKYVFGKEVPAGMGIQGDSYGDNIVLTAEDNSRTIIYSGELDDPSTWKQYKEYDKQVKVIGYSNGNLYTLIFDGNGKIAHGDSEFTIEDPVQDAAMVKEGILVVCMKDAKSIPVVYNLDGKKLQEFSFESPRGLISMDSDKNKAIIIMGGFGIPYETYRYDNEKLEKINSNTVSDFSVEENFISMQNYKVHYFYIKADKESHNTVVYGYGGFNISLVPSYNSMFAYLLDHGINVVICNLPGGGEYGQEWHKLGMGRNKINVFSSFQEIIKRIHDSGQKVMCYGVSNGGLLSSYTLTAIPELLAGAVIGNPVIDLMKFHKLLAGQYWTSEYGNPDNTKDSVFLKKYSPMHNLKIRKYPPSLIYSRLEDDRVHPYHAMAFYEKLIETGSETHLLMGNGGHLGANLNDTASETAYIASFIRYVFSNTAGNNKKL